MLRVEGLKKRFGETVALDGASFEVQQGQCFGLLGPNGAGKSTAISIIVGVLAADSGEVTIEGRKISSPLDPMRAKLGYVPQEIALYEELNSFQNLELFAALYGLSGPEFTKAAESSLNLVELLDRAKEPIKNFSGGMKRRLNIAVALLHRPELIILDEPTVGVDPQSRNAIFDTLRRLQSEGKTLIYTTHYMEEVEKLCDRIAIIDHGKVIANGSLSELYKMLPHQNKVVVTLADAAEGEKARQVLASLPLVDAPVVDGAKIELQPREFAAGIAQIATSLNQAGVAFSDLSSERVTLEEVFLHATGRSLRD